MSGRGLRGFNWGKEILQKIAGERRFLFARDVVREDIQQQGGRA